MLSPLACLNTNAGESEAVWSAADSPCLYSSTDKHLTQSEIYAKYHFTDSFAFYDATQGLITWELCKSAIREMYTVVHTTGQLRNGSLEYEILFLQQTWHVLERIMGNCASRALILRF